MEDELEDKILYQTYVSHMKLLSRFTFGIPFTAPADYLWKMVRLYIFRTEFLLFTCAVVMCFMYLQSVELWSRVMLSRLSQAIGRTRYGAAQRLSLLDSSESDKQSWEHREAYSAAYAIKGRRPHMEDRFILNENINNTGISLFAIFDGHGGDFAANYARDHLIQNLLNKIVELNDLKNGKATADKTPEKIETNAEQKSPTAERKKPFRQSASTAEDTAKKTVTDPDLFKIPFLSNVITREARPSQLAKRPNVPLSSYIENGKINYGKLLTDEVLAADHLLVEAAKRTLNVAGTTALLAIKEGNKLIVANVGDSRGVMCDSKGNAIPLSFDHKPQQMREQKRIKEAGGYIAFNGVWRVAGILATSRAMGDYPLKDKKFVIADPDILTFDLDDHKPLFLVLASDGLWDTFSNEEAVSFIKERLHEPHYGAKSLTMQSYYKGSVDNITVLVINFTNNTA